MLRRLCSSIIFKFWTAYLSSWPCRNVISAQLLDLVGIWGGSIATRATQKKLDDLFHGKSENTMDDDWGYPHFSKPSYCFLVIIFSDMVLSAVGVIQMYHHISQIHSQAPCSQIRVQTRSIATEFQKWPAKRLTSRLEPRLWKIYEKIMFTQDSNQNFRRISGTKMSISWGKSGCQLWVTFPVQVEAQWPVGRKDIHRFCWRTMRKFPTMASWKMP